MALEQFKTQVLLLHSQQSTLETLGAGFNDRYSVHYATTGSEALTTLGETPIHIIVSAQELPGMSGLEALREARKRSPDTIGILLAGDDGDDGLEALVGDREVFQIVRGAVTPDVLRKAVETAARRMRLLTISQSANDTAADVDEPGEHIIMETADNGASVISDASVRLPALKPNKIQAVADAKVRQVDVLVLTKDSEFLDTIRHSTKGLHTVHHAPDTPQAQDAVRNHPVGVLVTDAALAGAKVELLLKELRNNAPRLVAIVAGRRNDGEMMMNLINRGQIYRFLLKPVSPGRARLAIEASAKHHLDGAARDTAQPSPATAGQSAAQERAAEKPSGPPAAEPTAAQPAPKTAAKPAAKSAPQPAAQPAAKPAAKTPPQPAAKPAAKSTKQKMPSQAPSARKGKPADPPPHDRPAPAAASSRTRSHAASLSAQVAAQAAETGRFRRAGRAARGAARNRLPRALGVAAAGVLTAAGAWYLLGGADDEAPGAVDRTAQPAAIAEAIGAHPAITESDMSAAKAEPTRAATESPSRPGENVSPQAAQAAAPEPAYAGLLENARNARDAGKLLEPGGDDALDWYLAAREAAPEDGTVAAELAAVVDRIFGMAEKALLEDRTTDAGLALRRLETADPDNPRLAFLRAQLNQLELRAALDGARAAIRDARFQDAARQIQRAEDIPGAETAPLAELTADLAAARSAQQIDEVLARAGARLDAGNLTEPANDNARFLYELALSSDAGNVTARQGLLAVAGKLVLNARAAIDDGDLAAARQYLADARELDPDSSELAASAAALEAAQDRRAADEARAAADEERAAEQRRRAAAATLSTDDAAADSYAVPAAAPAAGAADARADFRPAAAVQGNAFAPAGKPAPGDAAGRNEPTELLPISRLTRVNYVAPRYPRNAQRRNITGWVEVAFTVTPSGSVGEVDIMNSSPGAIFDDAARDAVAQWRFDPVIEDGRPAAKRVGVRMQFKLE